AMFPRSAEAAAFEGPDAHGDGHDDDTPHSLIAAFAGPEQP
ncbi:MAG TPA: FAD-dependent oxidoreductase, partial [Streptomyces sp.]|nr:FAD-dependent oxidoreductase [Streptomyces sp.]